MCLAVPACIVSVANDEAVLDIAGIRRSGSVALIDHPQPGEWVVLHSGIALTRIDPHAADIMLGKLRLLGEVA
ncbi:MAG: HypC/HybG/HupF family hydrogenase formation chaperone [Acetobacteraceae bacterium]|nr:HypC/HybG/HupF family hydrogenase formation chaperone [Acetobacteraceae bacterium]